jgi:phage terminase large subunit-like protein
MSPANASTISLPDLTFSTHRPPTRRGGSEEVPEEVPEGASTQTTPNGLSNLFFLVSKDTTEEEVRNNPDPLTSSQCASDRAEVEDPTSSATSSTSPNPDDDEQINELLEVIHRQDGEIKRLASAAREVTATGPSQGHGPVTSSAYDFSTLRAKALARGPRQYLSLLGQPGYLVLNRSNLLSSYPHLGKTELVIASAKTWIQEGHHIRWFSEEPEDVWMDRILRYDNWPVGLSIEPAIGLSRVAIYSLMASAEEDIIIVDTIRGVLSVSNENDNSEMVQVIKGCTAATVPHGKTPLLLHHQRKASGTDGRAIAGGGGILACDLTKTGCPAADERLVL